MVLATVPEAAPTTKNQRATSCPAPISAKEPKADASRFRVSALRWVSSFSMEGIGRLQSAELLRGRPLCIETPLPKSGTIQQLQITNRRSRGRRLLLRTPIRRLALPGASAAADAGLRL